MDEFLTKEEFRNQQTEHIQTAMQVNEQQTSFAREKLSFLYSSGTTMIGDFVVAAIDGLLSVYPPKTRIYAAPLTQKMEDHILTVTKNKARSECITERYVL